MVILIFWIYRYCVFFKLICKTSLRHLPVLIAYGKVERRYIERGGRKVERERERERARERGREGARVERKQERDRQIERKLARKE